MWVKEIIEFLGIVTFATLGGLCAAFLAGGIVILFMNHFPRFSSKSKNAEYFQAYSVNGKYEHDRLIHTLKVERRFGVECRSKPSWFFGIIMWKEMQ